MDREASRKGELSEGQPRTLSPQASTHTVGLTRRLAATPRRTRGASAQGASGDRAGLCLGGPGWASPAECTSSHEAPRLVVTARPRGTSWDFPAVPVAWRSQPGCERRKEWNKSPEHKVGPVLTPRTKINSHWIKDLNPKSSEKKTQGKSFMMLDSAMISWTWHQKHRRTKR